MAHGRISFDDSRAISSFVMRMNEMDKLADMRGEGISA